MKNATFRKKNLKIFGFPQNVALHRGWRESAEISMLHKKLQLHRRRGWSSTPESKNWLRWAADLKKYLYKQLKFPALRPMIRFKPIYGSILTKLIVPQSYFLLFFLRFHSMRRRLGVCFNTADRLGGRVFQYGRSTWEGGTSHMVQIENNLKWKQQVVKETMHEFWGFDFIDLFKRKYVLYKNVRTLRYKFSIRVGSN